MNFELTKEQEAFRQEIREFALRELKPGTISRDMNEDCDDTYDILLNKMAPKGYLGLPYEKEYGGEGKSFIEFALALSEVCRIDVSVGAAYSVGLALGPMPIYKFGTEEQKNKYLPSLFDGTDICAFALTEPNAGSDSATQETTAVLDGDEYVLNGNKIYITNAGYARIYVVFAMTDKSKGNKGISAFIVEKDTPGFEFGEDYKTMGIRACAQRELIFKDCRIPKENLLGEEGKGFKIAMTALDAGRLGVASQGLGAAMGAYDIALKHAKERVQFGEPIAANEAVSFTLADMATKIEYTTLLVLKTAQLLSEGKPYSKEAAMAKYTATDAAMQISTDAVQICGGKGFMRDYEVERFMRDSKILQIYEGTNQIMRLVVSGQILK